MTSPRPAPIVLFASEHLDRGTIAVGALGASAACALCPGEGPSRNRKQQPNEDSLALLWAADALVACVADAHFGAFLGEELVRGAARQSEAAAPPASPLELARWVRALAASSRDRRPPDDGSESTFLIAAVRGRRVVWASVADSQLYRVSPRGAERLNRDLTLFAGADLEAEAGLGRQVVEAGELELPPGEAILLASDGLDWEMSGLMAADVGRLVGGPGTPEQRVLRLATAASRAPAGGRDNLALILVAPPA
jgi:serine/threonine protein phosphatase PrpC